MGGLIGMTMASAENSPIKKMVRAYAFQGGHWLSSQFLNDIGPFIPAHSLGKIASYVGKWRSRRCGIRADMCHSDDRKQPHLQR